MTLELPPDLRVLIDEGPIKAAVAENEAANARFQTVADLAKAAEASLREARAALPALLRKAVEDGVRVSDDEIVSAHRLIVEAEQILDLRKEIARRLAPSQVEHDARLSAARAQAYRKVLDRAIDMQIEAAGRGDAAAGTTDRHPDVPALAQAKADFEYAARAALFAIQHGARPVHQPTWPITALQLRRVWGREVVTQEAA